MTLVLATILLVSPTILKSTDRASVAQAAVEKPTPKSRVTMGVSIVAKKDDRGDKLAAFFATKKSPFAPYAQSFVAIADKYEMDYTLLPAIAGVESTYGLAIPANSFNPYGWNNGAYKFKSWVEATEIVANGIRTRYAPNGEVSPWLIGSRYAANPAWASHVAKYQAEIASF